MPTPIRVPHTAYRSLLLYSARLAQHAPFRTPIDTHLAECATPASLLMPHDPAMLRGLARSGFADLEVGGAAR